MPDLELSDVTVTYGEVTAVRNITTEVHHGQLACLLGPSGCGKTTLLRAIAGFEGIASGTIQLDQHIISSKGRSLPPEQRNIGMVFQDFALFPHLNIAKNISFGIRKQPGKAQQKRITELLELVNLPGYETRYPHELSGGQQQRIALARALAPKPKLLLLDEPFASQDMELRERLAREVREILQQEQVTSILVTHDQHEAFAMADMIGVIQHGEIQQWDTAYNLYHRPINQFVADFIGEGSIIRGEVIDQNTINTVLGVVKNIKPHDQKAGSPVDILIRPDDVIFQKNTDQHLATIISKVFRGSHFLYKLELGDGTRISALTPSHESHQIGEQTGFRLDMRHLVILNSQLYPNPHDSAD